MKKRLNKQFLKYSASSFVSSVAEEAVFVVMTWMLSDISNGFWLTLIPMAVARLVSCFINFYINQKLVFQSQRSVGGAMLRYFLQAIPVAVLQFVLCYGCYEVFRIGEEQVLLRSLIYGVVMIVLFVVSFLAQKWWVFSATEKAERDGRE